jgi:hypothetical protein
MLTSCADMSENLPREHGEFTLRLLHMEDLQLQVTATVTS